MAAGLGLLGAATLTREQPPRLIWNASASAPLGMYGATSSGIHRGAWVLVMPTPAMRRLITRHGALPPDVPLIKQVAATGGQQVCRIGVRIAIDDVPVAVALLRDSAGKVLPNWHGCVRLKQGELFLLQPSRRSLDGRYFGPIARAQVISVLRPLWTWQAEEQP